MKKLTAAALSIALFCGLFSAFAGCGNDWKFEDEYAFETGLGLEHADTLDVATWSVAMNPDLGAYYDNGDGMMAARCLQGVINKEKTRVYLEYDGQSRDGIDLEEVRQNILTEYGEVKLNRLPLDTSPEHNGYRCFWSFFPKYSDEIKVLYVYNKNPAVYDSANIAAMLAGRNHGLPCSEDLLEQIEEYYAEVGYTDYTVVDVCEEYGFTGENANANAIYNWAIENLLPGSDPNAVYLLNPTERDSGTTYYPFTYDLAVQTDGFIYNADPRLESGEERQRRILDHYPDATPVIGWPGPDMENTYVRSVSECGKTVVCADWEYQNGSVWASFPMFTHEETVDEKVTDFIPNTNKTYVAFIVNDGDAWSYAGRDLLAFWNNSVRGVVPIGWQIPSLWTIYNPLTLEYLYDTKADTDNFLQGPSGIGYCHPSSLPDAAYEVFLDKTDRIFDQLGITMVDYWDMISGSTNSMVGDDESVIERYGEVVRPDVIFRGHSSHVGGYKYIGNTFTMEAVGNFIGSGVQTADDILYAIDRISAQQDEDAPKFICINISPWGEGIQIVQQAVDRLYEEGNAAGIEFVTPAQLAGAAESWLAGKSTSEPVEGNEVLTYSFNPDGSEKERQFIYEDSGSSVYEEDDGTFSRYADENGYWVYEFDFGGAVDFAQISLQLSNEYIISGSTDGKNWTEWKRYSARGNVFACFDVLNLLPGMTDKFYIRIEDAVKTDGFGGKVMQDVLLKYRRTDGQAAPFAAEEK